MLHKFTDFNTMEKLYRTAFFNSLGGYKPAVLIGTCANNKQQNVAIFNSLVHVGANPAMIGLIFRPGKDERHTYKALMETKICTINHIHKDIINQAHQTSARYLETVSEFDKCDLTPEFLDDFNAPFVLQSRIKYACSLVNTMEIESNGTHFVVLKILNVYMDNNYTNLDGFVNHEAAETVSCLGLDQYNNSTKITRLSYAKPDKLATEI